MKFLFLLFLFCPFLLFTQTENLSSLKIEEIMKGKDMAEKETELLSLMKDPDITVEKMLSALGVGLDASYPDDISLLMVRKG